MTVNYAAEERGQVLTNQETQIKEAMLVARGSA